MGTYCRYSNGHPRWTCLRGTLSWATILRVWRCWTLWKTVSRAAREYWKREKIERSGGGVAIIMYVQRCSRRSAASSRGVSLVKNKKMERFCSIMHPTRVPHGGQSRALNKSCPEESERTAAEKTRARKWKPTVRRSRDRTGRDGEGEGRAGGYSLGSHFPNWICV